MPQVPCTPPPEERRRPFQSVFQRLLHRPAYSSDWVPSTVPLSRQFSRLRQVANGHPCLTINLYLTLTRSIRIIEIYYICVYGF